MPVHMASPSPSSTLSRGHLGYGDVPTSFNSVLGKSTASPSAGAPWTHSTVHHTFKTASLTKSVGLHINTSRQPVAVQSSGSLHSSGTRPSSPLSPSRLAWRELNEYAWVYGPAGTRSCFTPTNQSLHGVHSPSHSTCTPSHGSAEGIATKDKRSQDDNGAGAMEASPPVTLASLIRDSFKDAKDNCVAEMARLGKDEDSEVVHDLRVVLRRLRNMLRLFHPYLGLAEEMEPKRVSRLLQVLGDVRDTGAMMETLAKVEKKMGIRKEAEVADLQNEMPASHDGSGVSIAKADMEILLDHLHEALRGKEQELLVAACRELQGHHGKRLFKRMKAWAEDPVVGLRSLKDNAKKGRRNLEAHEAALLSSPLTGLAPSLLSPHVSSLLLHPAWFIDDIWEGGAHGQVIAGMRASVPLRGEPLSDKKGTFLEPDAHLCESAHDLRKHLRELRYAMELLGPVYSVHSGEWRDDGKSKVVLSKHYGEALAQVKRLQGVLGDLQDLQVLAAFLRNFSVLQQRRFARKAGKGKHVKAAGMSGSGSRTPGAEECLRSSVAMQELQDAILQMQAEVWGKWLEERSTISSGKGRYKLMKALSCKPALMTSSPASGDTSRLTTSEERGGFWSPVITVTPPDLPLLVEPGRLESEMEREGSAEAASSPRIAESNDVTLDSPCRLWSSRQPVTAAWDECEAFPEEMLPEALTKIVHEGADDIPILVLHPGRDVPRMTQLSREKMESLAARGHEDGSTRDGKIGATRKD